MNKGFTLIELLVVVLIIGILAAVALPQYQKAVEKSRLAEAQLLLSEMEKGANLWVMQNGMLSSSLDITDQMDIEFDLAEEEGTTPTLYCAPSGVCAYALSDGNVVVEMRKRSGMSGPPDYSLFSNYDSDTGSRERGYQSCGVDISNFGLESLGYESSGEC
ncbi:MAG: prepilin-type N-terminal cleavage/methylation domain-containing protein [Elusimicrobiaceae bacterium]|nr:prepilin-type N-terminal cleavage/methylation domain-containing protein [Elusimicrobiaceae bacterium]